MHLLEKAISRLKELNIHDGLTILRDSLEIPKLQYILQTTNCEGRPELTEFDITLRSGLVDILNVELTDTQWIQASLLVRSGELGFRSAATCTFYPDGLTITLWLLNTFFHNCYLAPNKLCTLCHLAPNNFCTLCHLAPNNFCTLCHLAPNKFCTLCHLAPNKFVRFSLLVPITIWPCNFSPTVWFYLWIKYWSYVKVLYIFFCRELNSLRNGENSMTPIVLHTKILEKKFQ